MPSGKESNADGTSTFWFLKVDEDQVRGPVLLEQLRAWAEAGSLDATEVISREGKHWIPAAELRDLEMDWVAMLGGGRTYGPFNILATQHLVERGILKTDTVLKRASAPARKPSTPPTPRADAEDPSGHDARIRQLEDELRLLREGLRTPHQAAESSAPSPPHTRALTSIHDLSAATSVELLRERTAHTEDVLQRMMATRAAPYPGASRTPSSMRVSPASRPSRPTAALPTAWSHPAHPHAPPNPNLPRHVLAWRDDDDDKLHELARVRRYRIQTLRWNMINAALVTTTGSIVGALGLILEVVPVQYSGLVLAAIGVVYFGMVLILMLLRNLAHKVALSVTHVNNVTVDHAPLRGALNITFYWFNRAFRSRPHDQ